MIAYNRNNPLPALIVERERLTPLNDEKETFHIRLDLDGKELPFKVGDSIGVYGQNDPNLVDLWLQCLRASGCEIVADTKKSVSCPLREYLSTRANLTRTNASLAKALGVETYDPNGEPLDLLQNTSLPPSLQTVCDNLSPLLPRFYSIASSLHCTPNAIDLTVAHLKYQYRGQKRFGVASHFLCEIASDTTPIPIYLQPTPHFTLPDDHDLPIIMIGPGTGIAPFRGFVQERHAKGAKGKNWLFFGERNEKNHFYYGDFWQRMQRQGFLHLSTAFSRDQADKIYVQHRLQESGKALWDWIQNGAHIFVCGDAEQMAKAVEATFLQIFQSQGNLTHDAARTLLLSLRKNKRYLTDVY
jgi:sulfite reductase (NADPH) flavoprotein alpha-component